MSQRVCVYCGKRLKFLQQFSGDGKFCSTVHRKQYQEEMQKLALEGLARTEQVTKQHLVPAERDPVAPEPHELAPAAAEEAIPPLASELLVQPAVRPGAPPRRRCFDVVFLAGILLPGPGLSRIGVACLGVCQLAPLSLATARRLPAAVPWRAGPVSPANMTAMPVPVSWRGAPELTQGVAVANAKPRPAEPRKAMGEPSKRRARKAGAHFLDTVYPEYRTGPPGTGLIVLAGGARLAIAASAPAARLGAIPDPARFELSPVAMPALGPAAAERCIPSATTLLGLALASPRTIAVRSAPEAAQHGPATATATIPPTPPDSSAKGVVPGEAVLCPILPAPTTCDPPRPLPAALTCAPLPGPSMPVAFGPDQQVPPIATTFLQDSIRPIPIQSARLPKPNDRSRAIDRPVAAPDRAGELVRHQQTPPPLYDLLLLSAVRTRFQPGETRARAIAPEAEAMRVALRLPSAGSFGPALIWTVPSPGASLNPALAGPIAIRSLHEYQPNRPGRVPRPLPAAASGIVRGTAAVSLLGGALQPAGAVAVPIRTAAAPVPAAAAVATGVRSSACLPELTYAGTAERATKWFPLATLPGCADNLTLAAPSAWAPRALVRTAIAALAPAVEPLFPNVRRGGEESRSLPFPALQLGLTRPTLSQGFRDLHREIPEPGGNPTDGVPSLPAVESELARTGLPSSDYLPVPVQPRRHRTPARIVPEAQAFPSAPMIVDRPLVSRPPSLPQPAEWIEVFSRLECPPGRPLQLLPPHAADGLNLDGIAPPAGVWAGDARSPGALGSPISLQVDCAATAAPEGPLEFRWIEAGANGLFVPQIRTSTLRPSIAFLPRPSGSSPLDEGSGTCPVISIADLRVPAAAPRETSPARSNRVRTKS